MHLSDRFTVLQMKPDHVEQRSLKKCFQHGLYNSASAQNDNNFCLIILYLLDGALMQERRKSARSRVFKDAKLIVGTYSVIDCIVFNVTNSGARIQIANTVELPGILDLTFDGGYTIRSCRIAWRTLTETGVEFFNTHREQRGCEFDRLSV